MPSSRLTGLKIEESAIDLRRSKPEAYVTDVPACRFDVENLMKGRAVALINVFPAHDSSVCRQ